MSKKLLPSKIAVGPLTLKVIVDDDRCSDAGAAFGFYDGPRAEIVVSTAAVTQQRDTLLHEILHGICELTGVTKGGVAAILASSEHEERLVSTLSPYILDTLRRNPQLTTFLLGGRSK